MTIGAIAKMNMDPKHVEYIEEILFEWEEFYPGFSTIESSSTWLDHIKCSSNKPEYCQGMENPEGIFFFNIFHYIPKFYNPLHLNFTVSDDSSSSFSFLNNAIYSLTKRKVTSPMKNMLLRGIIHILGDIHQPLHGISMICNWSGYPDQDHGGNSVLLSSKFRKLGQSSLHALFDSMGEPQVSFPEISKENLMKNVEDIMRLHPKDSFYNLGNYSDLKSWIDEAENFTPFIYKELIEECGSVRDFKVHPYSPSSHYVHVVQELSKRQVALAGYRLGLILDQIARAGIQSNEVYLSV